MTDPTVDEMLAIVREIDPSAKVHNQIHDYVEFSCDPALRDAIQARILRWYAEQIRGEVRGGLP